MKPDGAIPLTIRPCELPEANAAIASWHRHHKPVQGHRWSLKAVDQNGVIHGVAVCGRPVARATDQRETLEITRVATDGTPNACSMLYAACARAAKAMGFKRIQTFILDSEPGTSLKAAGFGYELWSDGGDWNSNSKPNRRQDQPQSGKQRWAKVLTI